MPSNLSAICKTHFFYSLEMLMQLPAACPGELWHQKKGGFVFWQQLLHALCGVHYWLRFDNAPFQSPFPGKRVYPELDREPVDQLSKKEITAYQTSVRNLAEVYFNQLTETGLFEKSSLTEKYTNLDLIFSQIRHLQYHVGHCNSILREQGVPAVEWKE